ncbi:MAG: PEP-CTERM sorting domain-containing protein [Opitutales bacterium]|nr:PEP-CTERM sorting domain-containing protein [Opitutales bacterium]
MKKLPLFVSLSCLVVGATAVQGQVVPLTDNNFLHVLNGGSFDAATGQYTRGGTDTRQGVVGSFAPVALNNIGDAVQLNFTWSGGGNQGQAQQVQFGFFNGTAVTGDNQTSATDGWEGYFQAFGTSSANVDVQLGAYRQGEGTTPLFARTSGNPPFSVDGQGGNIGAGAPRPSINQSAITDVSMTLARISDTQLQLTTVFDTPRSDGTNSGTAAGGVAWSLSVTDNVATLTSTYTSGPSTISGVGLASSTQNFTVEVIPEPSTYAILFGLGAALFVLYRRRARR